MCAWSSGVSARTVIGVVLALAVVIAGGGPARAASEYAVKADYLYKFVPFVEWPARVFKTETSPVNICIVGYDPFGAYLERAIVGQKVGERPLAARRLERAHPDAGCHIAYIAGSRIQSVAEGLEVLEGAPVLTVTDQRMGSPRGAIHFVVSRGRVRFHINDAAATANGVAISSKLKGLAVSVRPRRAVGG
jgi:hypothetical protein